MAAIHAVDLDAAGLADLARHEGYIARQLKRWYGQWNQQKTRDLPLVDEVHDARRARPRAGPGDDRPRRLPPRQHDRVRRRRRRRRARLGDLHARRPARRRRAAEVYWTGPTTSRRRGRGRPRRRRGSGTARAGSTATPRCPAATCPTRLLRRLRVLEAGLHPRGRVRPLPRRRARSARPRRARAVRRQVDGRRDGRTAGEHWSRVPASADHRASSPSVPTDARTSRCSS